MNKVFSIIGGLALCLSSYAGNSWTTFQNGNLYSNILNAAYNAGFVTNSSGQVIQVTNNFQIGTSPGSSNVFYYLSGNFGAQPGLGTNGYLPAEVFNSEAGYPGTLSGPNNFIGVVIAGNLVATNSTSTAIVAQFAGSVDGTLWFTNYLTVGFTVPINSTVPAGTVVQTNIQLGGVSYLALQQINNPGTAALTNILIEVNGKAGL